MAAFSVLYGGAHLFREGSAAKLGGIAKRTFEANASSLAVFAERFGVPDSLAADVMARTTSKLTNGIVDAQVIDFEDGYGFRPRGEERADAERAAACLAKDASEGRLAHAVGLRVRAWHGAAEDRGRETLVLFLETLLRATGGGVPAGFSVTLPKVEGADDVHALVTELAAIESRSGLGGGVIPVELMIETPRALMDATGTCPIPKLIDAAGGRCLAVHLGAYDLLSALDVPAPSQHLGHAACVLARQTMKLATSGGAVRVVDGATNELPIAPRIAEGWAAHARDARRALAEGITCGWVLHPAQLVSRWVACCTYFREALPTMTARLRASLEKAAQASLVGSSFDDAASVEGLVRFFAQGFDSGVIDDVELAAAGLRADELRPNAWRSRYGATQLPR